MTLLMYIEPWSKESKHATDYLFYFMYQRVHRTKE